METKNNTTKQAFGQNVAALLLAFKAHQVQSLRYDFAGENDESHQQDYVLSLKDGTEIDLEVDVFPQKIEFVKNDLSGSKPLIAREFIDALLAQACELTHEAIYVDNSGGGGTFTVDVESGEVKFWNYYNEIVQEESEYIMFKSGQAFPDTMSLNLSRYITLERAQAKVFATLLIGSMLPFSVEGYTEERVLIKCEKFHCLDEYHALLSQSETQRLWPFTASDVLDIEPALTQAQAMKVLDNIVGNGDVWQTYEVISEAIADLDLAAEES